MGATPTKDDVIHMADEHNVKFIRLWFTDVLGSLKSLAMTRREFEGALEEGMGASRFSPREAPGSRSV